MNLRNGIGPILAVAALDARNDWEDTVLECAAEALDYAKHAAPWADRTGEAREGLDVDVDSPGDDIVLTMYHTAPHGRWLETIQGGNFAIIMPTLERYGQEIKQRIERG